MCSLHLWLMQLSRGFRLWSVLAVMYQTLSTLGICYSPSYGAYSREKLTDSLRCFCSLLFSNALISFSSFIRTPLSDPCALIPGWCRSPFFSTNFLAQVSSSLGVLPISARLSASGLAEEGPCTSHFGDAQLNGIRASRSGLK